MRTADPRCGSRIVCSACVSERGYLLTSASRLPARGERVSGIMGAVEEEAR